MAWLSNWFVRNPVAANLLMAFILIAGLMSLYDLQIEGFPKIPPDTVSISVLYPGASASQVDQAVSRKLESAIEGLPGVKRIASLSSNDSSLVEVQAEAGYDLDRLVEDIKIRVDAITSMPALAERPIITREAFEYPALIVQVYGDADLDVLQRVSSNVRRDLLTRPEISKLRQWGDRKRELHIEIDAKRLEAHDLTLAQVAERINRSSLRYRSGELRTEAGTIRLRADQLAYRYQDFNQIPILADGDGTSMVLGDIATIRDEFEEGDGQVRYQGKPAIGMEILMDDNGNLLTVSQVAHEVIAQARRELPDTIDIDIWADQSGYISDRLDLLKSNALQGLVLVLVLLTLFLNLRVALWVAVGIPVAIAGAIAVMGLENVNYSLNDVTTFGMIIVLGILVDDAVVVAESVFDARRGCADPIAGTDAGVARVSTATVFGILTSVAAFYPLLLIDNPLGKVLASFAGVVIIALLFSLVESKLILPAHLAAVSMRPSRRGWPSRWLGKLQDTIHAEFERVNHRLYVPLLRFTLVHRYATAIVFVTAAVLGVGLIVSGKVKTVFFPDVPGSIITVTVEMDKRTPYPLTVSNAARLEREARKVNDALMLEYALESPPIARIMTAIVDTHTIEMYAELTPEKLRTAGTLDVLGRWRDRVGRLEGADVTHFAASESTGGGFAIAFSSRNEDTLRDAVDLASQLLRNLEGVHDVRDDLKPGEPEIFLALKPQARHLGLSVASLAQQIGDGYGGLEVQRIQRDADEMRISLRFSPAQRSSVDRLMRSRVTTEHGDRVPLLAVVDMESRYADNYIARRNGKRTATLHANIDKTLTTPQDVVYALDQGILARLDETYPELDIEPIGELQEEQALRSGLVKAFVLTAILIYALLAVPLKSYTQPFVIMSVIPFGLAGAAVGHLMMDIQFSVLSFFGMMALSGIVVNDSLVMLTRYNQLVGEGVDRQQALVAAGSSRFRAIFLTTATTIAGLLPLLSETSEQAQYLIPAAVSIAYGEFFATGITLILIPVLLSMLGDLSALFRTPGEAANRAAQSTVSV